LTFYSRLHINLRTRAAVPRGVYIEQACTFHGPLAGS